MNRKLQEVMTRLAGINQQSSRDGAWPKSKIPERRMEEYERWKESLPTAQDQTWPETDDYDLPGAFLAGAWPEMQDDGYYHLFSMHPKTGLVLKKPGTESYRLMLEEEERLGNTIVTMPNGREYSIPKAMVDGDNIKGWF